MSRDRRFATNRGCNRMPSPYRFDISNMLKAPPLRIVIIDDYQDSTEVLAAVVEDLGPHVVSTFATADAALAAWPDLKPELALIDIGLPQSMDGCELARRVQGLSRTYLVAVTGYNRREDLERCRDAGFHEHIVKPFSLETLEDALNRAAIFMGGPSSASD